MAYQFITVDRDGPVTTITLNRPDVMNALHSPAHFELHEAFDAFAADPEQWVAIVTGAGERAFSAGNDLKHQAMGGDMSSPATGFAGLAGRFDLNKPLIAAVNGIAMGGGFEVALACDLIVASETARFGQPEINLGVLPGAGGTQRLTRAVGKAVAMDMILTGRTLTAREALDFGLVARVVAREAWLAEAKRVAGEIAAKGPVSVRLAKEAVDQAFEAPLTAGVEFERRAFYLARASEDAGEGLTAFLEKRPPEFKGR